MMVVLLFFVASNTIDTLLKIEMDIKYIVDSSVLYCSNIPISRVGTFTFLHINAESASSDVENMKTIPHKICMSQRIHRNPIMCRPLLHKEYNGFVDL